MKAGFIKLYMPILKYRDDLKSTGYQEEFFDFVNSIYRTGDDFALLSPNDLSSDDIILRNGWINKCYEDYFLMDYLFIFNSKAHESVEESNDTKRLYFSEVMQYKFLVNELRKEKERPKIVYVITDLNCVDNFFLKRADVILSQAATDSIGRYCAIEKLFCNRPMKSNKAKYHKLVYIGNDRKDRRKKFIEYFRNNPDLTLYGSWGPQWESEGRVTFDKAQEILERSKYTIIISDKKYSDNNFMTPRLYEAWQNNVIAFVDHEYDTSHTLSIPDRFLIVKNQRELLQRIHRLENDKELYKKLLEKQKIFYRKYQKDFEKFGDKILELIK